MSQPLATDTKSSLRPNLVVAVVVALLLVVGAILVLRPSGDSATSNAGKDLPALQARFEVLLEQLEKIDSKQASEIRQNWEELVEIGYFDSSSASQYTIEYLNAIIQLLEMAVDPEQPS